MRFMLKWYIINILLTILVTSQCPRGRFCAPCNTVPNYIFEIECLVNPSIRGERFIIKFHPYEYMYIICDQNPDWSLFHLGEKNPLASTDLISFKLCKLPERRMLSEIVKQVIQTDVKALDYQSFENLTSQLYRQTFTGFKAIEKLVLPNNNLTEVPVDLLHDLVNLRHLDMSFNLLRKIPSGFFNLPNLEFIDLSNNKLEITDAGLFKGLQNLKILNLEFNKLTEFASSIFNDLASLRHLNMADNNLKKLPIGVFEQLKALKSIDLSRNNFTDKGMTMNLFQNNSFLESVTLDNNKQQLHSLPNGTLSELKNLITVSLRGNGFTKLPEDLFTGSTNLQNVSLTRNKISKIPENFLQNLENIRILDLANNEITDLSVTTFKTLGKLEILDVSQNRLKEFRNEILDFLTSLKILNLANNQIERIKQEGNCAMLNTFNAESSFHSGMLGRTKKLNGGLKNNKGINWILYCAKNIKQVYLHGNMLERVLSSWIFSDTLELVTFHNNRMKNLTMADLQFYSGDIKVTYDGNEIETISFDGHDDFRIVASSLQVNLGKNPINCDCRMHDFLRFRDAEMSDYILSKLTFDKQELSCAQPPELKDVLIDKLDRLALKCLVEDSNSLNATCPKKCLCWQRPEDQAYLIDCSYRNLTKPPESLRSPAGHHIELNLTGNLITEMPLSLQPGYLDVTKLILSENKISALKIASLSDSFTVLTLDSNNLTKLDLDVLDFFKNSMNLSHLTLHNNPWICSCDTVDFLRFIQAKIPKIVELRKVTCASSDYPIFEMTPEDICIVASDFIVIIGSIVAILGIFIGVIAALYYRYQYEIKAWLYARQWCLWFVTEDELDKDKEYDAFVSFSQQDALFVTEILLPTLEEGPHAFNLCVHYRDWIPGETIPNQIANSVKDSKRTIIILSPDYLESVWSRVEFRTAHEQSLNEGRARVIIILLGDIESLTDLDSEMQTYLSMNTYLKWGDKWFWEKLNYALPHPNDWLKKRKKPKELDFSDPRVYYSVNENTTNNSDSNVQISM